MEFRGFLSPDEFWGQYASLEEKVRDSFPWSPAYQLVDWDGERSLGEWSFSGTERGIVHRRGDYMVLVRTSAGRAEQAARLVWVISQEDYLDSPSHAERFAGLRDGTARVRIDGREFDAVRWRDGDA
ncbi:MAG TPA: hypothetical protein VIL55_01110, partial [Naasia sp.]